MYPVDTNSGPDFDDIKNNILNKTSKLATPIQSLMKLIFDIESMQNYLLEMKIDPKKMPLVLISKDLIKEGFQILTKIQQEIENKSNNRDIFLSHSNQFYTLIPQDYGGRRPPMIDNTDLLKEKTELLQTLEEIVIAKSLLQTANESNPIDESYKKLKCDIQTIDKDSEEYELIDQYLTQTQSSRPFKITLKELFCVSFICYPIENFEKDIFRYF